MNPVLSIWEKGLELHLPFLAIPKKNKSPPKRWNREYLGCKFTGLTIPLPNSKVWSTLWEVEQYKDFGMKKEMQTPTKNGMENGGQGRDGRKGGTLVKDVEEGDNSSSPATRKWAWELPLHLLHSGPPGWLQQKALGETPTSTQSPQIVEPRFKSLTYKFLQIHVYKIFSSPKYLIATRAKDILWRYTKALGKPEYGSLGKHLISMCEALDFITCTTTRRKMT